jgi:predicted transcriptional regulator
MLPYYQNFIYMINRKTISENIKKMQTKLGLTQDDLSKKAGINTMPMKVEGGIINRPSVQTMAKITKVLGISIKELLK